MWVGLIRYPKVWITEKLPGKRVRVADKVLERWNLKPPQLVLFFHESESQEKGWLIIIEVEIEVNITFSIVDIKKQKLFFKD